MVQYYWRLILMEELLKQILTEIKDMKLEIRDVKQGQNGLNDKVQAFENQVNNRFNNLDKKLDTVYSVVADLIEFRVDTEQKLKKVK